MQTPPAFQPPKRLLMGPGPSEVSPSVLKAMSLPLLGHLDPVFVRMMDEIKVMLRSVFLTRNEMTFPVSGTGSAGMEFCFVNLIEPGDEVGDPFRVETGEILLDVGLVAPPPAQELRRSPSGRESGRAEGEADPQRGQAEGGQERLHFRGRCPRPRDRG